MRCAATTQSLKRLKFQCGSGRVVVWPSRWWSTLNEILFQKKQFIEIFHINQRKFDFFHNIFTSASRKFGYSGDIRAIFDYILKYSRSDFSETEYLRIHLYCNLHIGIFHHLKYLIYLIIYNVLRESAHNKPHHNVILSISRVNHSYHRFPTPTSSSDHHWKSCHVW